MLTSRLPSRQPNTVGDGGNLLLFVTPPSAERDKFFSRNIIFLVDAAEA